MTSSQIFQYEKKGFGVEVWKIETVEGEIFF